MCTLLTAGFALLVVRGEAEFLLLIWSMQLVLDRLFTSESMVPAMSTPKFKNVNYCLILSKIWKAHKMILILWLPLWRYSWELTQCRQVHRWYISNKIRILSSNVCPKSTIFKKSFHFQISSQKCRAQFQFSAKCLGLTLVLTIK